MQRIAGETIVGADYRLVRFLANGEAGALYVAEQLSTGSLRALKMMHPEALPDPSIRERFEREARVGSRIESEHVVEVFAAGVDAASKTPFMVMELLEGDTLEARVKTRGPLDLATATGVFEQLCHALAAAHRAGIVHRDLRPENVFLTKRGVKVLEFGIARIYAETRAKQKLFIPSSPWMAPEQRAGRALLPAADVWALGLCGFFILTGKYFWRACNREGATATDLCRESMMEPIPAASSRARVLGARALPPGFDAWFARCVNHDESARFRSAGDAIAAWEEIRSEPLAREPIERDLLATIRADPSDAEVRQVYADWLEERGHAERASFLRADSANDDAPSSDLEHRLRALASPGDAGWRAVISRPAVGRCVKFEFACPKRWDGLSPTADDSVRHCSACASSVYFCSTVEEARERGARRECVAVDAALVRQEALDAYDAGGQPTERGEVLVGRMSLAPLSESEPPPPPPKLGVFAKIGRWFRGKS